MEVQGTQKQADVHLAQRQAEVLLSLAGRVAVRARPKHPISPPPPPSQHLELQLASLPHS
jgi:hypothetical protein